LQINFPYYQKEDDANETERPKKEKQARAFEGNAEEEFKEPDSRFVP
jgi:hypothetical protein